MPLMTTELNLQRGWMMQPLSKQLQVNVKLAVDENEDPDASDSEEGVVECDDTREAQEEEIIKTSTEFLHIIAQQKAYILRNKLPKSLLKELLNIENAIVAPKVKSCNTQTKLLSFSVINFGQL